MDKLVLVAIEAVWVVSFWATISMHNSIHGSTHNNDTTAPKSVSAPTHQISQPLMATKASGWAPRTYRFLLVN